MPWVTGHFAVVAEPTSIRISIPGVLIVTALVLLRA
jgi:hypothetical protein